MNWDKIFANDPTDKGLISKYTERSYDSKTKIKKFKNGKNA